MNFEEHLKKYLTESEITKLNESLLETNKHAVLLNTRKMNKERFLSLFPNVNPHPFNENAFIYDKNEYDLGKSIYHLLGCFYLQEPSALVPSALMNFDENDIVLDICAAPGGKSIQASFKMKNNGTIISNDLSSTRAKSIVENIERLGIKNIIVTNNDFAQISDLYKNYFTKIILDAPCSGSGMFRKNIDVKNDWTYEKVIKYSQIQKDLIISAYNSLKPGGVLSYSTCSFSFEENEEVIQYLLDNTDAEILPLPTSDLLYISKSKSYGAHLFPSLFPGEGQYICQIKKPGELKLKETSFKEYKFGDFLFLGPDVNLTKFNIVRLGCKVGEITKDIIKYSYHYSHLIDNFNNEYILDKNLTSKYINGESINDTIDKGFVLLKYDGISLDIAKSDGIRIKNRIPSYIRMLKQIKY